MRAVSRRASGVIRHGSLRQAKKFAGWFAVIAAFVPAPCAAQTRLGLQQAVDAALQSRPSLKADAERVNVAKGTQQQAGLWPNPEFQFGNENLRPGQTYTRDVDTLAYVTQPLDILGKRQQRVVTAGQAVLRTQAEYELSRRQVVHDVALTYWAARGAQERRDLLKTTVQTFQQVIDYHRAQLSVGAIAEQDVLRVELEGERLQIAANLATLEANRTRIDLMTAIGRTDFSEVVLTDPLDAPAGLGGDLSLEQVVAARADMKVAQAAIDEARANEHLQNVLARPDISIVYGYKRTQLPDAVNGVNTGLAAVKLTVPLTDRNQGNRAAAAATTRQAAERLAATEAMIRADVERARQDFALRRDEVVTTLQPLREHASTISQIAQGAYAQGGVDLLRLIDAQRAQLDAELAWVDGMVAFQQSRANLEAAEGGSR